jgi:hypothetical protein
MLGDRGWSEDDGENEDCEGFHCVSPWVVSLKFVEEQPQSLMPRCGS